MGIYNLAYYTQLSGIIEPNHITMKKLFIYSFIVLLFMACSQGGSQTEELAETSDLVTLAISYEVPGDLPSGDASEADLARFAWNEFFALNWKSSWDTDNLRGTPDTGWDFATSGAAPDLSVWETYIHRIELRPANGTRSLDLSSGKPYYTFGDPVNTTTNNVTLDDYWVNLDEDNEIGSCYLFAYDTFEVLYMAKSNLSEYNYIKNNFPNDDDLKSAISKGQGLDYLKKATLQNGTCNSDTATSVICLPCGSDTEEGAIEIKTAWRFLDPAKGDDVSRFLVKEAVYYTKESENAEPVANTGQFGLIGMHIIHKTQNYPAFVFASWEQVDVRSAQMQTIGLDTPKVDGQGDPNVDPHRLEPVIDRAIPATLQTVNQEAQDLITGQNPESVWQYYQLIGVQGKPLNYADRAQDDNYFMANYVIESDSLLTFFHGSFKVPFADTIQNVVYKGESFNMGGCQGCHGQAQVGGTDFSFLLDFAGKPVAEPDPLQSLEMALEAANPKALNEIVDAYSGDK